jgi:alpha-aminoadipic semialdehyde synthase
MLVNGIYWDKCFPRLISNEQLRAMSCQGGGGSCSLKVVADITCDVDGSVECLSRTSSIESPYYTYDPAAGITLDGIHKQGVLMLGIDNLPSELPRDASEYFGSALMPIIPQLLLHSASRLDSTDLFIANLPPVLQRACIAADGSLTPRWSIIDRLRHKYYNNTTAASGSARDAFVISPSTQLRTVSLNVELVVSRSSTSRWMVEWMDGCILTMA